MSGAGAEVVALLLLGVTLVVAVTRPAGLPEAVGAVPAALLTVAVGLVPGHRATQVLRTVGPTIGFLAAILVLAALLEAEGMFRWVGERMAAAAEGQPVRLLALVFAASSLTTVALSLDATVVLLTPVVFVAASRARVRERPNLYACAHLANSASILLPVSNLTNLLALSATGLSFAGFGLRMALPWTIAVAAEWVALRWFFRDELRLGGRASGTTSQPLPPRAVAAIVVTLAGFVVASLVGITPAFAATAGAVLLAAMRLRDRSTAPLSILKSLNIPFLGFVAGLVLVVEGAERHGLGSAVAHLVPSGSSLPALLGIAALGAVAANIVNNVPALLVLLPAAAASGPGAVLALLIGVNAGPNLTYVGSLATLLWRRGLRAQGADPALGEFARLGVLSVPVVIATSVTGLWLVLRV